MFLISLFLILGSRVPHGYAFTELKKKNGKYDSVSYTAEIQDIINYE